MRSLVLLLVAATCMASCSKSGTDRESVLYGIWIKGTGAHAGDTLLFFKKGDKHILAYNASFNASLPAPQEVEYTYTDGKLSIKNYLGMQGDFFTLQSFTWKEYRKEFEIQGSELYMFMASTLVRFTYRKVK